MQGSLRARAGIGGLFGTLSLALANGVGLVHLDHVLIVPGLVASGLIVSMPEASERRGPASALFGAGLLVAVLAFGWGSLGWGPDALPGGLNAGDLALPLLVFGLGTCAAGALLSLPGLGKGVAPDWEPWLFSAPLGLGALVVVVFLADAGLRILGVRSGPFPPDVYRAMLWTVLAVGALVTGGLSVAMLSKGESPPRSDPAPSGEDDR